MQPPEYPVPIHGFVITPRRRGEEQRISDVLHKMTAEDPTLVAEHDPLANETVLRGLGDLHLRSVFERMASQFKLEVETRPPRVPYRETITAKAEGHHRHKKQTGGAGQFGEVYLKVEPLPRGSEPSLEFEWAIFGGSIPGNYEPAIKKGVHDVMDTGAIAGFPMQDIKVSITDGKHHPVDSKEVAFRTAGKWAFKDAVQKAKPVLLEPYVDIEVMVPAENVGDITG